MRRAVNLGLEGIYAPAFPFSAASRREWVCFVISEMENQKVAESEVEEGSQFRWILIFYHANKEHGRSHSIEWYDTLEECKLAAGELDFDYCCGYSFEYEKRSKPPATL